MCHSRTGQAVKMKWDGVNFYKSILKLKFYKASPRTYEIKAKKARPE